MNIRELQKSLQKTMKMNMPLMSESEFATPGEIISTPAYDMNRILSGSLFKGLTGKTFTIFCGPEASYKSGMMAICVAALQKKGYLPVIIDAEGAWTKEWAQRWGIDTDNCLLPDPSPFIADAKRLVSQLIENKDTRKIVLVLDSIGGLIQDKVISDAVDGAPKGDVGGTAKEIKPLLKMIVHLCKSRESIAMASAHFYANTSGYGANEELGGGKYVKLAADIIVSLKKTKKLNKDKEIIGTVINAITLKNRLYPPFSEGIIDIDYVNGLNPYAGIFTRVNKDVESLAVRAGIVVKGGAWLTYGEEKFNGETAFLESINNNKPLRDKMLQDLELWLQKTGYSSTNEEVAAEAIAVEEAEVENE